MWPDRVSNPGPLVYESGALPTAMRSPAFAFHKNISDFAMITCLHIAYASTFCYVLIWIVVGQRPTVLA